MKGRIQSTLDHVIATLQQLGDRLQAHAYFELGDDQEEVDAILCTLNTVSDWLQEEVREAYKPGRRRPEETNLYFRTMRDLSGAVTFLVGIKQSGLGSCENSRKFGQLLSLCLRNLRSLAKSEPANYNASVHPSGGDDLTARSTVESAHSIVEPVNIGIVMALPEEFEEFHREIEKTCKAYRDDKTSNYYYLFERPSARLNRQYRCIATFIGSAGPQRAGLAAQRLMDELEPSTLVMLGIAASLDDGVKLGDVVVANQIDAYLDNSKAVRTEAGFAFQRSGEVYRASGDLVKRAENLRFAHKGDFQQWTKRCAAELHRLFPEHQLLNELIEGKGLLNSEVDLQSGHIASGPTVSAAQAFKEWLKGRDRKYLALEMEAAGLMSAVYERVEPKRTLVLRAISDCGDERKKALDKFGEGVFRRYAMHNATQLLWSLIDIAAFPK